MARHAALPIVFMLVLSVGACGAPPSPTPPPRGTATARGAVALPAGSPLKAGDLKVAGPYGSGSVGSDGKFSVEVDATSSTLVHAVDGADHIVLMGFVSPSRGRTTLSAASTSHVLLYLALGAFTLPGSQFEKVIQAIADAPQAVPLAGAVEGRLGADPLAIMDGDAQLVSAVVAVRDAFLARGVSSIDLAGVDAPIVPAGEPMVAAVTVSIRGGTSPGPLPPTAPQNVLVSTPGERSGIEILPNPDGPGIVARNSRRRDVSLFVYQVASAGLDGVRKELDKPVRIGDAFPVPATREAKAETIVSDRYLSNVVQAAFAPVFSAPVELPLVEGSATTFYTIVAVGPTLSPGAIPALFTTAKWFGEVGTWKEEANRLAQFGLAVDWIVPLHALSFYGGGAAIIGADLKNLEGAVRGNLTEVLAKYGITDLDTVINHRKAVEAAVEEAGIGGFYKLQAGAQSVLGSEGANATRAAAVRTNLGLFSKGGSLLLLVDAFYKLLDSAAILKDLVSSSKAESWDVTIEAAVKLDPPFATVKTASPSATFTASVKGDPNGRYLYRWSTTGKLGTISDYIKEGTSVDTTSEKAFYLARDPASINAAFNDTVTVEVFANDSSGKIPAGAKPLGKATAIVSGGNRPADAGGPVAGKGRKLLETLKFFDTAARKDKYCLIYWYAIPYVEGPVTYRIHMYGFNSPTWGTEQNITIGWTQVQLWPDPLTSCPYGNYRIDNEIWSHLPTVKESYTQFTTADLKEMEDLFASWRVDVEVVR